MPDEDQHTTDTQEIPGQRVRAKFTCTRKEEATDGSANVTFCTVVSGSPENQEFFQATPNGLLTMNIVHPQVAQAFEQGRNYYLDFTPAD